MSVRVARGVIGFLVVLAAWWGSVIVFDVAPFFLPSPADIIDAFGRHGGYLAEETWATIGHTLGGLSIAIAAGLAVAIALAASSVLRDGMLPMLVAMQAVPKVSIAPLLLIWLGFGTSSKVALVTLLCFFPVVVSALAGLTSTPVDLIELSQSLSASRWQTFIKVRIPHALPQIFTGLKVAVSLALIGAVVAQITTPNSGLGAVIMISRQGADTSLAFAAITLLAAIGIALFYSLATIERLTLPWAKATTG